MAKEILIVDDEPNVVVPIQFLMEQQGYRVMIAERGEDALDLICHYKPDLVILDIMLPGMDGYEVCEIVRLNPDYRNINIRGSSAIFIAWRIFGNATSNNSFANLICLFMQAVAKSNAQSNPIWTLSLSLTSRGT
jgi:DNA-binding NtrC family response regulator